MLLIVACKYRLIAKEQPPGLKRVVTGPELKRSSGNTELDEQEIGLLEVNGNGIEKNGGPKAEPHKPQAAPGQEIGYGDVGEWEKHWNFIHRN